MMERVPMHTVAINIEMIMRKVFHTKQYSRGEYVDASCIESNPLMALQVCYMHVYENLSDENKEKADKVITAIGFMDDDKFFNTPQKQIEEWVSTLQDITKE